MRRLRATAWALLALAWALVVWGLLTAPAGPASSLVDALLPEALQPWQDKLGHAGLFLVQALLIERAGREHWGWRRAALLAVTACLLLGVATELRQRSVPERDADAADLAADALGAFASLGVRPLSRRLARAQQPA